MKFDFKNSKFLFFLPLFFTMTYVLILYNHNFSMNGSEYEFFFSEALCMALMYMGLEIIFYLLLFKFISNKHLLALLEIAFVFLASKSIIGRIVFCIIVVLAIVIKKQNPKIKSFCEIVCILLFLMTFFLFGFNTILATYRAISFASRNHHYTETYNAKVDENKESPNIYWIHMDGMPSLDFIRKYYKRDIDIYQEELEEKNLMINSDAFFRGGHHTLVAINALYNPNYYDHFLGSYLDEFEKCDKTNCATKESISFKDVTYARYNNEFFKSFKEKGYTTIGIEEFNQYTSMDMDIIYDIWNTENDSKIKYFENHYNKETLYKYILKIHRQRFTGEKYHNTLAEKEMDLTFNDPNYPWIQKTKILQMRAIMTALEDSYKKNENPKLYFIDNTILHLRWDYDENGQFLRMNNNSLDDFDDTYIYTLKLLNEMVDYIQEKDPTGVIVIQGDHGIHCLAGSIMKPYFHVGDKELSKMRNSTISAIYIPEQYKNGEEEVLNNPLNISRYLVNNFVGENYEYLK
ncbi:MAG: hypothetical protein IKF71_05035 [Bacilli bacterium]|nr:hypothetical protein [Bacilli bacterium]